MLDRANDRAGSPQTEANAEARPVTFRGAGFTPKAGRYSGWIALALVIAFWQLAGSAGWVNALFLPAPSAIAVAIYKLALSGALWQHLSWSIMRIGSGWVLGTTAGVIVGFAIGLSTLARGVNPPPRKATGRVCPSGSAACDVARSSMLNLALGVDSLFADQ